MRRSEEDPGFGSARFHDDGARHAVLRLVCTQAARGVFINLFVWAMLLFALREEIGMVARWVLFGFAVMASGPRLWMALSYQRRPDRWSPGTWEALFSTTIVVSCAVWGAGSLYLLPRLSPMLQLLVFAFIVGMAGGTAILYFAQSTAVVLSVSSFLVPTSLWFAVYGDGTSRIAAAAGFLIVLMTARAVRLHSGLLHGYYRLVQEVDAERRLAETLARTDQLTELANRRAFHEAAKQAISQATRRKSPLTLLLLDLDDFKSINDQYGHAKGDEALQAFANALRRTARDADPVGRLGGDEFAVLLNDATAAEAQHFATRLRAELEDLSVAGTDLRLRCSLGAAQLEPDEDLQSLLPRADRALYESKRTGRDRISVDRE